MISPTLLKVFLGILWVLIIIFPIVFFPSYIRYGTNYNTIIYNNNQYNTVCNQTSNSLISLDIHYENLPQCNKTFIHCILYNATNDNYYYCNNNSTCIIIYYCNNTIIYENYMLIDNNTCIYINYPYNYFATICAENDTFNTYVNDTNFYNQKCISSTSNNSYTLFDILVANLPKIQDFKYDCQITVSKNHQLYLAYTYLTSSKNITYIMDSENIDLCCCNNNCSNIFTSLNQSCIFGSCSHNGIFNIKLFSQVGLGLAIIIEIIFIIVTFWLTVAYKKYILPQIF